MFDFHCPPTIVKFQPQLLKTWIRNKTFGFLEQQIADIPIHLELN